MLALTFANKEDYDKFQEDDSIDVILSNFLPGEKINIIVNHADGSKDEILANHTYNENQIEWFKSGSALNLIKKQSR